ncbi:class I SAM-dependent methyltransferase [Oceanibacterium hippocampi]|uniref:Class I SAM-dependent methyltransferase n=1 Tax=Oceanibacterium hippocampi TaxID=745714 RepID=A0A1Y5RL29_9PROT|nr:class I SAM-dependent methyltransferase [Oceanibacterium hippocampi]SLN20113.1 hypothetical protein OCH7691_00478 [Oceanibacterium hippocampi]
MGDWRIAARRLRMGLMTLTGLGRQGYFIPYRYAGGLPAAGEAGPYAALERLFRAAEPAFTEILDEIDGHEAVLGGFGSAPPPEPRWRQDWFPGLDGAAAYALMRRLRPRRAVEIGSGHSTRFLARAIADGGFDCAFTAIDPAPRAAIGTLPIEVRRETIHAADRTPLAALQSGDLLFIDSSHILMPGSDVDLLLNEVLPTLPAGLILHVHDIFLPDDYPPAWAWRGYNEQQGVAPLLAGGGFDLVFASHYVRSRMGGALAARPAGRIPLLEGALESSLWLRKRAPAIA